MFYNENKKTDVDDMEKFLLSIYYSVDTKIFLWYCKKNCRYLCLSGKGHNGLTSSNTFSLIKDLGLVKDHNPSIFL